MTLQGVKSKRRQGDVSSDENGEEAEAEEEGEEEGEDIDDAERAWLANGGMDVSTSSSSDGEDTRGQDDGRRTAGKAGRPSQGQRRQTKAQPGQRVRQLLGAGKGDDIGKRVNPVQGASGVVGDGEGVQHQKHQESASDADVEEDGRESGGLGAVRKRFWAALDGSEPQDNDLGPLPVKAGGLSMARDDRAKHNAMAKTEAPKQKPQPDRRVTPAFSVVEEEEEEGEDGVVQCVQGLVEQKTTLDTELKKVGLACSWACYV